ncbi:hypothetical protein Tco_1380617, partial [Tanacetum coccineum]
MTTKSDGFEQIAKTINGEAQLHALVDGQKIIITESSIRRDLQLADEEGVVCLPNSTIFEQLTLMGYEKISQKLTFYKPFFSPQWKFLIHTLLQCLSPKATAWNEFSSTMASAIICLATNQKFNFSKFIFESMIRNLDNLSSKFLMYPRFVQVFLDQQLDGMSTHKRIYIAPSHTKKIFGNMRRVDKGFSGRLTPLFPTIVIQNQSQLGEGSVISTDPHHTPTIIQSLTQPQKIQKPMKPKRNDTQVPQSSDPIENVIDEAVHKELGDSLVRAATTASSLEAEQDNGNINKTQSKATPNESSSLGTTSGGGPRCQETIGDTIAQTRFESVSKHSNDSLLARGNTLQSDEDRLKLDELMALCTTLQNRVLDLEKTKTTQHNEIASLKRRVKKLKNKNKSRTHKLKRLYKFGLTARVESFDNEESLGEDASKQGRIDAIDVDEEITLVSVQNVDEEMFDVNVLDGEEVFVTEQEVAANKENNEVNVVEEVVEVINTANAATIITVDDITLAQALMKIKSTKPKEKGAKIDANHQLAERIQAQEQEELSIEEKATLFQQLLEKRRKHFAAKRAEKKRNKPPTKAQQRKIIAFKTQKVEDNKEIAKLKQCLEIIPDEEEVTIEAIPLAVKSPSITGWKIYKEGRKSYYQIMRVDGKSQT